MIRYEQRRDQQLNMHFGSAGRGDACNDMDQRLVELTITSRDNNSLTVLLPDEGTIAPPGFYMLFIVDQQWGAICCAIHSAYTMIVCEHPKR